jgi:elongation factor G
VADLSSHHGRIPGTDTEGRFQIIRADVPAMELCRYASILRSLTGGRGVHCEQFSRYEEMPREIEQHAIDEAKKARTGNSSLAR